MRKLKRPPKPGRAAVVVPNGTLFGDGICARIKEELLKDFNLHTIVRLPNGVFAPYTSIPTNLLFFDRSHPTEEVWYYEQPLPEGPEELHQDAADPVRGIRRLPWNGGTSGKKTNTHGKLQRVEYNSVLAKSLQPRPQESQRRQTDFEHLPPEQLADDILKKEQRIAEIMDEIKAQLAADIMSHVAGCQISVTLFKQRKDFVLIDDFIRI